MKVLKLLILFKFGTFKTRKARNPQTGAEITISAATTPVFKAGKSLKYAVKLLRIRQYLNYSLCDIVLDSQQLFQFNEEM